MKCQEFIMNLPSEIIIDILSRLPIKTIPTCKFVCKKWLNLISSLEFAKSHLLKSTPGLIVYLPQEDESQCTFYEFEDVLGLQRHDLHYKPVMKFDLNILRSSPEANVMIECSFKGLICLRDDGNAVNTLLLCNPITREYIHLPTLQDNSRNNKTVETYGIGMSMLSGQYKVVLISHELENGLESSSCLKSECMVYTLGTGLWRSVESNEVYEYNVGPPNGSFLNGNLHWLVEDAGGSRAISCFDLETELFKSFPAPPFGVFTLMTVVGECLCATEYESSEEIVIWMMKEYGVEGSWSKVFVYDLFPEFDGMSLENGMAYETVIALKVFKDGSVLMLQENTCLFYYRKETRTYREVDVFGRDKYGWIDALVYTPSFLSLKSFGVENVTSF